MFSSEDARQSAFVDSLSFDYSIPTLAEELTAEVTPATVTLGESNTFDYYIRSTFGDVNDGFDRVGIRTPFKARVNSVELDGVPVAFTEEDAQDESRLAIQLTNDRVTESGQLLRIRFEAMVTVYGTTFFAKVFDSQTGELGQDVVAGDATPKPKPIVCPFKARCAKSSSSNCRLIHRYLVPTAMGSTISYRCPTSCCAPSRRCPPT